MSFAALLILSFVLWAAVEAIQLFALMWKKEK
jgi:hypothetical protein